MMFEVCVCVRRKCGINEYVGIGGCGGVDDGVDTCVCDDVYVHGCV